ncbi:MAG: aldehyde dehydrogenase family protein, partial [Myxococcales bacterium]|nr:aldehyde dehydrogenase family protein [Myxococcales bacterium]
MIAQSLLSRLSDPTLVREQALLAGDWVTSANGQAIDVRNPSTGEVLAQVPDMGLEEIRAAITAADRAQKSWALATGKERAMILRRWYDLVMANQKDLATILTAEMGKPFAEAMGEVAYGAGYIEWFGEEAKRIYGDTIPGHHRDKRIIVLKQPVGVVAAITPWNFPS